MTAMKSDPRSLTAASRRLRAFELRRNGATFRDIGEDLNISTQAAFGLVQRELQKLVKLVDEGAETLLRMELERLDALNLAVWAKAISGDLPAIDRALRIMERRARLLGLDAPAKVAPTDPTGKREYQGGGLSALLADAVAENKRFAPEG